jgi:head-tail adaptor
MQANRLRHRITIQQATESQDPDTLEVLRVWYDYLADVPAEVLTGSGRRTVESGTRQQESDTRINIRWINISNTQLLDMRIIWENRIYSIEYAETDITARRELRLFCKDNKEVYYDGPAPPPYSNVTLEVNDFEIASIAGGTTYNLSVTQGGLPVGSWDSDLEEWVIPECEDATVELNGVEVATIPSGGLLDIPVLQGGSPVGSLVSGEWIVPECEPAESCELEEFAIINDGTGQTTTLSGTNDSIITVTSIGTTNTQSVMGALNTSFLANANPIVWLGEAVVTAQAVPELSVDSQVWFGLNMIDAVTFNPVAGVIAAWQNGASVNKLQDSSDNANLADIDLSNGFKVGMYYDVDLGKVYAALDSETTFELDIQNAIVLENAKNLGLIVTAGEDENTSISVQFNQSGTDTIQAFESVPWCLAQYCEPATSVLKDTDGNIISETEIPSGDSADIEAPDAIAILKTVGENIISETNIRSAETAIIIAPDATANLVFDGELVNTIQIGSGGEEEFYIDCDTELNAAIVDAHGDHAHGGTYVLSGTLNDRDTYVKNDDADRIIYYSGTRWVIEKTGGGAHTHEAALGSEAYPWLADWSGDAVIFSVTQATIGTYCGGGSCADATVEINGAVYDTVASGGTIDIPVIQDGSPVGSIVDGEVIIPSAPAFGVASRNGATAADTSLTTGTYVVIDVADLALPSAAGEVGVEHLGNGRWEVDVAGNYTYTWTGTIIHTGGSGNFDVDFAPGIWNGAVWVADTAKAVTKTIYSTAASSNNPVAHHSFTFTGNALSAGGRIALMCDRYSTANNLRLRSVTNGIYKE